MEIVMVQRGMGHFIGRLLAMPLVVTGFMLAGALVFQALLYIRYGQSLFDNMDLPGADFAMFQQSPAVIRWPAQLVARACHLWLVQPQSAVVVLVVGTVLGWTWVMGRYRTATADRAVQRGGD